MITGDYDRMTQIVRDNVCSEHKMRLNVVWFQKSWAIRCGEGAGHYPDAVTRQLSLTQEYKAGVELPEPIKSNVEKSIRRRQMTQDNRPVDFNRSLIPQADLGSGALIPQGKMDGLINWAEQYGLDAYRGHVVLMYDKPYVTIDGYLYNAKQSGLPYTLESRPLKLEERVVYIIPERAHAWVSFLNFPKSGTSLCGIGIVTQEEITEEAKGKPGVKRYPVASSKPQQTAQKRAEWQVLRRGFPVGYKEEHDER